MRAIQPVHTARISVSLRELSIGQTQEICAIPYQYEQRTITAFLRAVCAPMPRPNGAPTVDDPLMWSVNERMNATIFYMAAMLEDGPDFALGDLNLHDYLIEGADYVAGAEFESEVGPMVCAPLHGYQAEVIEELVQTGVLPKTYASWQIAVFAACVRGADDSDIEYVDPVSYRSALLGRIEKIKNIPERQFLDIFHAYEMASARLQHFVHAVFNVDGVVARQVSEPEVDVASGVPFYGSARFHPNSGISRRARQFFEATSQSES